MPQCDEPLVAVRIRAIPLRRLLQALVDTSVRTLIVLLVSWPLLLVAILAQERLEAAAPPGLVAFFLTLFAAKLALLAMLARRV